MKLLAIDGNSIINRAFYGIKMLSNKEGQSTNAIYGFINILNRLIETEKPDGVAVAFDLKAPTFRHKMYSEYKAGRKPMPEELASQMPIMKEWLTLAGYTCVECEGFEADDILGTFAEICENSEHECVISTGDRDSLQLVSEHTRVLLAATRMGKTEIVDYTPAALFEKYGLTPPQMIELKALMGDSSDNIPGVAGVGEKTATDLITRFGSIDSLYSRLDTADIKEGVRNKLMAGKESAYLSRELGTICRKAPIDGDIHHYKTRPAKTEALARLMTKLEFFKLMEKMGLEPDNRQMAFSLEEEKPLGFRACDFTLSGRVTLYSAEDRFAAVGEGAVCEITAENYQKLYKNPHISLRVFDYKNIYKQTGAENVSFDAMLAAYVCNPSASSYGVDRIIGEYSPLEITVEGSADEFLRSACRFSLACNRLEEELKASGQSELYYSIELPLSKVLGSMEKEGFLVDREGLLRLSEELGERISVLEGEIYSLVGYEFNLNSPKQLGIALFEKLGLPAKKKTKSGYSTNAEVLEELRDRHPAVALLLEYRQLSKLRSTYAVGLYECIAEDGRIHTTFNQTEARTGRISSLEPNLQNIPVRTEEGKRLREFFVAPKGRVLCDADYSQIELRVLASISEDKNMIEAFRSGVDIHTATAAQVFGLPVEMVTPVLRSRAKAVNFGIVYGIGAFSLAKDIGVSRAEADGYIKSYLATYPSVAEYMERTIAKAKEDGFVTTCFGRRRYIPEIKNSNGMLRAFGERVARNAPIQGTAADIIKIAMVRVHKRLAEEAKDAKLILQVHDELIVECRQEDANKVCRILSEEMAAAAALKVELTADSAFGKTWLEAKG